MNSPTTKKLRRAKCLTRSFPLSLQSALTIGALLFGVFGFLYTLYGTLLTNLPPPPIVTTLRALLKILAVLMFANFVVLLYSLYLSLPPNLTVHHLVLAFGLALISLVTVLISLWLAFVRDR